MLWDSLTQVTLEIKSRSGVKNRSSLGEQVQWKLIQQPKASLQLEGVLKERLLRGQQGKYCLTCNLPLCSALTHALRVAESGLGEAACLNRHLGGSGEEK